MLQVQKIEGHTLCSNTYVLSYKGESSCFLVDIGDFGSVKKELSEHMEVKGVFITHAHFDHIYGLNTLIERFPNCIIYISENGRDSLFDDKRNFSFYHEKPLNFKGGNIHVVQEGENIEIFDSIKVECIYTPGHDKSCMTFRCGLYLFTGDSYIPGQKPVTKLKGGNREEYERGLKRILSVIDPKMVICPGHGEMKI